MHHLRPLTRTFLVLVMILSFAAPRPAQAGAFRKTCKFLLGVSGIHLLDPNVRKHPLAIRVMEWEGGRTLTVNFLKMITVATIGSGGALLTYNYSHPDTPALSNITIDLPDGSHFNANVEERALFSVLMDHKLGDGTDSAIIEVAESIEKNRSFPHRIEFKGTGVTAIETADTNFYDVVGLKGFHKLQIKPTQKNGLAFQFRGGKNFTGRDCPELRVTIFYDRKWSEGKGEVKKSPLRHQLSTGFLAWDSRD